MCTNWLEGTCILADMLGRQRAEAAEFAEELWRSRLFDLLGIPLENLPGLWYNPDNRMRCLAKEARGMQYKIAIVDDVAADREAISDMVHRWAEIAGNRAMISPFPSAESFLFDLEDHPDYNILLVDVEMRDISGIDLAKRLRAEHNRAEIAFITSHFEFISEGYEVDALHYLVKPVSEEKLFAVLDKAAERLTVVPASLVVSCEGETVKLLETDILYAEAFAHYLEVHTRSRMYRLHESISTFAAKLSPDFYRPHRSYIINLQSVERISRTAVWLEGGIEIPLARGKYDDVNRRFIERN